MYINIFDHIFTTYCFTSTHAHYFLQYGHSIDRVNLHRLEDSIMKVLSMIQPWASLFVLGEAKYETRSWRTNYRGPLAIHTSKKIDKAILNHVAIKSLLGKHGYTEENLPTGMIIAVCKLENCLKVTENNQTWALLDDGRIVSGNDYFIGGYPVGGYVWEVRDMQMLDEFIPAKGKLGLWEHEIITMDEAR